VAENGCKYSLLIDYSRFFLVNLPLYQKSTERFGKYGTESHMETIEYIHINYTYSIVLKNFLSVQLMISFLAFVSQKDSQSF
jgi:hypothetical protein